VVVAYSYFRDKTQSAPEEVRDGASREGAVSWRFFFCQLTARATLETRGFRGSKASEKTGVSPV